MSSPIPTVHLQNLFSDLDFLAIALPGQKPCFKNRYYVEKQIFTSPTTWFGPIWRGIDGEKQEVVGNNAIDKICKDASQSYESYKNDENFGPILMDKIVAARQGLDIIAKTYESISKTVIASTIRNGGIIILDNTIPRARKLKEGIIRRSVEDSEC